MISIKINQKDVKRIKTAINRVVRKTIRLSQSIPRSSSIEYSFNVINAIVQQKYGWAAYRPYRRKGKITNWGEYKKKKGLSLKKWVATGELLANIKSHLIAVNVDTGLFLTTSYFAGIHRFAPNRLFIKARALEKGRTRRGFQPPRPVFKPEHTIYKGIFLLKLKQSKSILRKEWY